MIIEEIWSSADSNHVNEDAFRWRFRTLVHVVVISRFVDSSCAPKLLIADINTAVSGLAPVWDPRIFSHSHRSRYFSPILHTIGCICISFDFIIAIAFYNPENALAQSPWRPFSSLPRQPEFLYSAGHCRRVGESTIQCVWFDCRYTSVTKLHFKVPVFPPPPAPSLTELFLPV